MNPFWRTIRQAATLLFARLLGWGVTVEGLHQVTVRELAS